MDKKKEVSGIGIYEQVKRPMPERYRKISTIFPLEREARAQVSGVSSMKVDKSTRFTARTAAL